jgi:hypothetical protein
LSRDQEIFNRQNGIENTKEAIMDTDTRGDVVTRRCCG